MTNVNKVILKCLGKNRELNQREINLVKRGEVVCPECGNKMKYKNGKLYCPYEESHGTNRL